MTNDDRDSGAAVARQHLLTGAFHAPIVRIEVHRIDLRPGQRAPRHVHPGGVVGYVVEGEIIFEIDGHPATTLRRGSAFYEPPGVTINRFDNASEGAPATFIAFYPLAGDQALLRPIGGR